MTPSDTREIDARIAQEVFGYKIWPEESEYRPDAASYIKPSECAHYSTSIADALPIVEKLNVGMMSVELRLSDKWYVTFDKVSDTFEASSESLPEAICLAALAAVSGERTR